MKRSICLCAALALIACAQPEPITDHDAPYLGGKGPAESPRPAPLPTWVQCPDWPLFDTTLRYRFGTDPALSCMPRDEPDRPKPDRPTKDYCEPRDRSDRYGAS